MKPEPLYYIYITALGHVRAPTTVYRYMVLIRAGIAFSPGLLTKFFAVAEPTLVLLPLLMLLVSHKISSTKRLRNRSTSTSTTMGNRPSYTVDADNVHTVPSKADSKDGDEEEESYGVKQRADETNGKLNIEPTQHPDDNRDDDSNNTQSERTASNQSSNQSFGGSSTTRTKYGETNSVVSSDYGSDGSWTSKSNTVTDTDNSLLYDTDEQTALTEFAHDGDDEDTKESRQKSKQIRRSQWLKMINADDQVVVRENNDENEVETVLESDDNVSLNSLLNSVEIMTKTDGDDETTILIIDADEEYSRCSVNEVPESKIDKIHVDDEGEYKTKEKENEIVAEVNEEVILVNGLAGEKVEANTRRPQSEVILKESFSFTQHNTSKRSDPSGIIVRGQDVPEKNKRKVMPKLLDDVELNPKRLELQRQLLLSKSAPAINTERRHIQPSLPAAKTSDAKVRNDEVKQTTPSAIDGTEKSRPIASVSNMPTTNQSIKSCSEHDSELQSPHKNHEKATPDTPTSKSIPAMKTERHDVQPSLPIARTSDMKVGDVEVKQTTPRKIDDPETSRPITFASNVPAKHQYMTSNKNHEDPTHDSSISTSIKKTTAEPSQLVTKTPSQKLKDDTQLQIVPARESHLSTVSFDLPPMDVIVTKPSRDAENPTVSFDLPPMDVIVRKPSRDAAKVDLLRIHEESNATSATTVPSKESRRYSAQENDASREIGKSSSWHSRNVVKPLPESSQRIMRPGKHQTISKSNQSVNTFGVDPKTEMKEVIVSDEEHSSGMDPKSDIKDVIVSAEDRITIFNLQGVDVDAEPHEKEERIRKSVSRQSTNISSVVEIVDDDEDDDIDFAIVRQYDDTFNELVNQYPKFMTQNSSLMEIIRVAKLQKILSATLEMERELEDYVKSLQDQKNEISTHYQKKLVSASRKNAEMEFYLQQQLDALNSDIKTMEHKNHWEVLSLYNDFCTQCQKRQNVQRCQKVNVDDPLRVLPETLSADKKLLLDALMGPCDIDAADMQTIQNENFALDQEVKELEKALNRF